MNKSKYIWNRLSRNIYQQIKGYETGTFQIALIFKEGRIRKQMPLFRLFGWQINPKYPITSKKEEQT